MTNRPHYNRAPIAEAVIDIQYELPPEIDVDAIDRATGVLQDRYPTRRRFHVFHGNVSAGDEFGVSARREHTGYQYLSADEKRIFRVTTDGFTFSWLMPYERWEVFRDEAKAAWDSFVTHVSPTKISRVAVRYVNRLNLPGTTVDLDEYFRSGPNISDDISQALSRFFCHFEIQLDDSQTQLNLNMAGIEPDEPETVSILLDIDVFRTIDLVRNQDSAWDLLETLHTQADHVFEACITDKTRELII